MIRVLIATLFRVRILTAQRGGEGHGAAWAEFDTVAGMIFGEVPDFDEIMDSVLDLERQLNQPPL